MKHHLFAMLASSSLIALASTITAYAADPVAPSQQQTADAATPSAAAVTLSAADSTAPSPQQTAAAATPSDEGLEEVTVTARRREENIQIVPETVQVVTSQNLANYDILQFQDIQKLIPGLTLANDTTGYLTGISMRGVSYEELQNTPPTVSTYLNDAPVDTNLLFQSMYDVGQIESLRGPQGTLRGEIAPSGALTITTHRPDLDQFGGYFSGQVGSLRDNNEQGALNVPIVQDKFAVRLALDHDVNTENQIDSAVNPESPHQVTEAGRFSMRFAPTDNINTNLTYQHLDRWQNLYTGAVIGSGAPGGIVPNEIYPAPPAGYNGPVISPGQLTSDETNPGRFAEKIDDVEALADWTFHGQKLSYVGSGYNLYLTARDSASDNMIPHYDYGTLTNSHEQVYTQELRLSSVQPLFDRLDYTSGVFYRHENVTGFDDGTEIFLSGAFGSPRGNPILGPPNLAYTLFDNINLPSHEEEKAAYANLTFHFDKKTEITGGVRFSEFTTDYLISSSLTPAKDAVFISPLFPCALAGLTVDPNYPGVCDATVSAPPSSFSEEKIFHPVVYNAELSHRFTDELMAYFRTATSFRAGSVQPTTAISGATTAALVPYIFPKPEESHSYEVGFKSEFLDKRLLFDIDYYHQTYSGLFFSTPGFYYLNTSTVSKLIAPTVGAGALSADNVPATVDGIELNVSAKPTPHWTITGALAWANSHLDDATIPCNPPGVVGVPTLAYMENLFATTGNYFATCKSATSTSASPRWNFNVQSEYDQPINSNLTAFIRGLVYYYPSNPFTSPTYTVPAYATLDLYLGLRRPDSKWTATAYAKNLADNRTITSQSPTESEGPVAQYFGYTGYYGVSYVPEREYGLILRYAFGSP